ncbi:helix-turn-helix domain-containing protein [Arthrobacter sp. TMN-37]
MSTFKERLDIELQKQGKTQAALAAAVGVSAATASQWRAGTKTPSQGNVLKIAEWLEVPPAWLLLGHGDGPSRVIDPKDRETYRMSCKWYYRPAPQDGGRELGNAAGFAFTGGIDTLARETGQNILDEKRDGEANVVARYTISELSGPSLKSFLDSIKFGELRPHLEAASTSQQKVATVIKEGLRALDEDARLLVLKIEDYGANGLLGEEYDDGKYMAVVRNILDSQKGDSAGGSYGLGKSVMWACSQFGLVLVNSNLSVAQNGHREGRFIGRMDLPWHRLPSGDGTEVAFAGPAWFGEEDPDKGCTRSYWGNNALAIDTLLERVDDRSGTSFLIVGAFDPKGDHNSVEEMHDALARALARNFWPAMVERSEEQPSLMTAIVRSERNGKQVKEEVVDPVDREPVKTAMLRAYLDGVTVEALEEPGQVVQKTVTLKVPKRTADGAHGVTEHEAVLLVSEAGEDDDLVNQVYFMRGSHMIIKRQSVQPLPMGSRPFHALVLVGLAAGNEAADRAAERFLRAAEPPAHNDWVVTADVSRSYATGYRKALQDFWGEVRGGIREIVSRPSQDSSDGPDGIKELLRISPPGEGTTKRPRVKSVSGRPDVSGRWVIEATVALPPRRDAWRFSPTIRFGTESGAAIPVVWESLTPLSQCAVDGDLIVAEVGVRTIRFRGVTDTTTHPVGASRAKALVDVRVYKGSIK